MNIILDWDSISFDELDHFPETFTYLLISANTNEVLYIGIGYRKSTKTEINRVLRRFALAKQDVTLVISFLDCHPNNVVVSPISLNSLQMRLCNKYQPKFNSKVLFEETSIADVSIKNDNFLEIRSS